MPLDKRMISMIDSAWQKRRDNETDPKQFQESPQHPPIAEPPQMAQEAHQLAGIFSNKEKANV